MKTLFGIKKMIMISLNILYLLWFNSPQHWPSREWLLCPPWRDGSGRADFQWCALAPILYTQFHRNPLSRSGSLWKGTQGCEKAGEICIKMDTFLVKLLFMNLCKSFMCGSRNYPYPYWLMAFWFAPSAPREFPFQGLLMTLSPPPKNFQNF